MHPKLLIHYLFNAELKHLAIITTHPIQYNAPWFRLLAERGKIAIKVFYTWSQVEKQEKYDPGFGKNVRWDIPLLERYNYTFVENISKNPGSKSYSGIDNPTLIAEINEWKPDAILVFGWKFKSHLKAIKYFHGKIPVLFRGDSHLVGRESGLKSLVRNWVLKYVFRKVDYALYVGKENRRYFEKSGLTATQLAHVPHAVDNSRFRKTDRTALEGMEYRRKMGIGNEDLVFLFAGKFEAVKNPLLLLRAAEQIDADGVHFVFAGNGQLESEMKEKAPRNAHFIDFQNQQSMPGLYQMCDVYVLPSFSETWGLAVNEAMAAGKPVLVSDKCGCAVDLVDEGRTGYIFRSGDAEDLKAKLELLASDKEQLKLMGNHAYEKIQDWSFEKIVTVVEDVVMKGGR